MKKQASQQQYQKHTQYQYKNELFYINQSSTALEYHFIPCTTPEMSTSTSDIFSQDGLPF
jgi:hypothetical protein